MARGKYKNVAEARAVRESAIAEAARLRKDLAAARMDAEALDRSNVEAQAFYQETVNRLRIQLAANTSDKVDGLQEEVASLTQRINESEADAKVRGDLFSGLFGAFCDHLTAEHGWTASDALQFVVNAGGLDGYVTEDVTGRQVGAEGAYRIELARGLRSPKAPSGLAEVGSVSPMRASRPGAHLE